MSRLEVAFSRYDPKRVFAGFEIGFTAFAVCFSTFEFFLRQSKVQLARYGQTRVFAGFQTLFTAFAVPFLVLWRVFSVDQRYRFLDRP